MLKWVRGYIKLCSYRVFVALRPLVLPLVLLLLLTYLLPMWYIDI